jgi:hypothetical protein
VVHRRHRAGPDQPLLGPRAADRPWRHTHTGSGLRSPRNRHAPFAGPGSAWGEGYVDRLVGLAAQPRQERGQL